MKSNSLATTGIDVKKILGQAKYWGKQEVAITDEIIGISQLVGARSWAARQVYAYVDVQSTVNLGMTFRPNYELLLTVLYVRYVFVCLHVSDYLCITF